MREKPLWCDRARPLVFSALAVLAWSVAATAALAGEVRTTADLKDAAEVADRYVKQYGAEHVLLILDVDNTLLAMNQPLGSDQWFTWQENLLKTNPHSPYLVADTFDGLLKAQGLLYKLGMMHPPQSDGPAIIARLQDQGIYTLVLTSRGDDFRDATERELSRNGFDFNRSALPVKDVPGGAHLPYDPADPTAAGLTPEEVTAFQLGTPRPVSYGGGIYMVAGQNKGAMLLVLLPHVMTEVKAVVFADDNQRNIDRVYLATTARHIEATVFRYHREDANVRAFEHSGKWECIRHWRCVAGRYEAALQ